MATQATLDTPLISPFIPLFLIDYTLSNVVVYRDVIFARFKDSKSCRVEKIRTLTVSHNKFTPYRTHNEEIITLSGKISCNVYYTL